MAAIASLGTAPVGTVDVLREIDGLLDRVHTGDVCGGPAAATALGEVDRVITRLQAVRLSLVAEADRSEAAAGSGLTRGHQPGWRSALDVTAGRRPATSGWRRRWTTGFR